MKAFNRITYNVFILLVYLFTLQAATGSALFSIYTSVSNGIVYIKQHKPKPSPRHQVFLRKHLNVNNNEKTSNATAFTCTPFSLSEVKDFVCLIISNHKTSFSHPEYGKLKDRAPPHFS